VFTRRHLSRREALKSLAIAAGVVSLSTLPERWQTPLIETGTLPAYAETSVVKPALYRVRSVRQLTPCENQGRHHIFIRVQDSAEQGINGLPIRIEWGPGNDQYAITHTGRKPYINGTLRDGVAEFAMFRGFYWVSVLDGETERAGEFTADYGVTEYCGNSPGNSLYHVSFEAVMQRV